MIYLDYASTTPIRKEILDAYQKVLRVYYGNADSLHQIGRESQKLMEKSRAQIAQLFSVSASEIFFTSCASESNSWAIKGFALANMYRGKHIITTCVEHSSVLHACDQLEKHFGFEVTYLPITKEGIVDIETLKQAFRKDTILVSVMAVNNETGALNPIEECAKLIHEQTRAVFHVDAVQAVGKINIPYEQIDMVTVSAHKIYGCKGSAILYKKDNLSLLPLINGGQQESGIRGGTSNAPVNIVFAKTLRLALEEQGNTYAHVKQLNDTLRQAFREMDDVTINSPNDALPHILNVSFLHVGSEIMLNALNERGICVSAQSTCSSHKKAHSYVLSAMGLGDVISTHAIRISLSYLTTMEEIQALIKACKEINHDYGTK